jgi:acetyltransferase-like isoleucine patch superfamily enzyme
MIKRSLVKSAMPAPIYEIVSRFVKTILAIYYRRVNTSDARYIDRTVHVLGWRNVRIGRNSVVSEGGWLNVNHRSQTSIQIDIEDNCFIGRRNFFSSGALIRIGSYCLTGIDCKFMGSNHIYCDPFLPYIATGTTKEDTIDVGVNCWFGANVSVVGEARIGHGSIIGANAVIIGDIPAFSLVVGNPGRVIKRYDLEVRKWIAVAEYCADSEAKLPSEAEYLEILRARHPCVQMPIRAAGKYLGDLA